MDVADLPVRINACGHFHTDRSWRLDAARTRGWRDLDLWLLLDGMGTVATPEGVFPLLPGTCLIMRGGEPYDFRPAGRLRHTFVHFDWLRDGRALPTSHPGLPRRHRRLFGHGLVAGLLERVVADHRGGGVAGRASRWLQTALLEIARQDAGAAAADPRDAAIDGLCARIRDDPHSVWRFGRCAAELAVGADRFARLFRARAGCSPRAFVTRARLDHACTLLRESSAPIAAIARQAGYADPHFFSRHFARHHGRPPAAFRREARSNTG